MIFNRVPHLTGKKQTVILLHIGFLCLISFRMRERLTFIMSWAVILSEFSHVFCCVLPTVFSVLSILAGLGMIAVVPGFILHFHTAIHAYEIPIIATSGIITIMAWFIYLNADKVDCHSTGCVHEPCDTRKSRAGTILKIGTVMFIVNLTIFTFLHYLPDHGYYTLGHQAQPLDHD